MNLKLKKSEYNIAAVSLIEIMMVFAIIGIVSVACMGLAKPKYEYMKKIRLYSTFETLEKAGHMIANEGHLDFTTDINTCNVRNGDICADYTGILPNSNSLLPKVSARAASSGGVTDPGLNITRYASMNSTEQQQFKYLQDGLCQRLAHIFNLPSADNACPATANSSALIDDATNYPQSFIDKTPQMYLSNGQVIYLSKNLYTDYTDSGTNPKRNVISINTYTHEKTMPAVDEQVTVPGETRLAYYKDDNNNTLKRVWEKNRDYFNIYVDTNCKMVDRNDKQCGPDKLNDDVFLFRMYRDGTVLPDYRSGFPLNYLTAKILKYEAAHDRYVVGSVMKSYSKKPIVYARCYANLMGNYSGTATGAVELTDYTGICLQSGKTIKPLQYNTNNGCVSADGSSTCKVIMNKPSFLLR